MTTDAHEQIPLIDTEALDELRAVLGDELDEIVGYFVDQLDGQVDAVRDALTAGDCRRTMESAHSLKGGAGNFGASRLSGFAGAIERAGRDDELPRAAAHLAGLLQARDDTLVRLVELGYCRPR